MNSGIPQHKSEPTHEQANRDSIVRHNFMARLIEEPVQTHNMGQRKYTAIATADTRGNSQTATSAALYQLQGIQSHTVNSLKLDSIMFIIL
jgi:hypothetical protein